MMDEMLLEELRHDDDTDRVPEFPVFGFRRGKLPSMTTDGSSAPRGRRGELFYLVGLISCR